MKFSNPESLSLIEALHSTPARRYLSHKPISDKIIRRLLDAAIRAPSGGNTQRWAWIIVRNQDTKNQIAKWYLEGWQQAYGVRRENILNQADISDKLGPKNFISAEHLANNIQHAPVWIFAVMRNTAESNNPKSGSSIYGAVQNLMLAARAHGIGTTLTTLYDLHEEEVKNLLNIPKDAMTMALIPLGYPNRGRWSEPKRRSIEEVSHSEKWGRPLK